MRRFYINIWKPASGFVAALGLFLLFLPVMTLTALALLISNNGKVFFFQRRAGLNERIFLLIKFRTLRDTCGPDGRPLPDQLRQFGLGNFLRHYHIDELPQLLNIMAGHLQLIGPRPLLVEYLPHYTERQRQRHSVRPGMTGLSQVLGGNALNWRQRLRLDAFYARKCCAFLDVWILYKTLTYLLRKDSVRPDSPLFSPSFLEER